jgi:hypothetical protein
MAVAAVRLAISKRMQNRAAMEANFEQPQWGLSVVTSCSEATGFGKV